MTEIEIVKLFKCLADRSRLQIIRSLALEDMDGERLAQRLQLSPSTVNFHLKKLLEVKAVNTYKHQYYVMYSLRKEVFDINLRKILDEVPENLEAQEARDIAYSDRVIAHFFVHGKLKNLPTQLKKREIVLDKVLTYFQDDQKYSEQEVHLILSNVYEDFVVLKHLLIAERKMSVEDGFYRKMITKTLT